MAKRQQEAHCEIFESSRCIYVWADDHVIEQVEQMPAATSITLGTSGARIVYVDPRYNIDQVAKEIHILAKRPSKWEQILKIMVA